MKLVNVSKCYKNTCALSNINLQFQDGKITAILGESGAGKTTLLNVIMGTTDFVGTIDGMQKGREGRRNNCSYLFQTPKLFPNLSVEENVAIVLESPEKRQITDMLDKVGLGGKECCYPHELSGGERQRVCIARAFMYPHDILLMDEPFSSLDLSLKKNLIELVYRLWMESQKTIIFVTHDAHEAAMLAHRAVILSKGRVAMEEDIVEPYPRDFLIHGSSEEKLVNRLLSL